MKRSGARTRRNSWRLAALWLAGQATMLCAQSQPSGAPTREDLAQGQSTAARSQNPARLSVEGGIERAPCPLADPSYDQVTVRIDSVEFTHLEGVSADALRPAWIGDAGKDVPVARLCEIRDRAATILRSKGYLAAVQIPPQRIERGGRLVFDVLMARLTRVQVRGDAGNSAGLIERLLMKVSGTGPFNVHAAERSLLLARDLPGYDIRLVLRPATDRPGEIDGEALVTRQRVQADINVQNLGSRQVGPYAGLARVQINDLTGLGDATVLSFFNTADTREQTVLGIAHSFAFGSNGARLNGDVTYAWSQPSIANNQLRSRTLVASASLSYPLVRRQAVTIGSTLGFDYLDQSVRFGSFPLTTDRLRTFAAGIDAEFIDPASIGNRAGYSVVEPRWRVRGNVDVRQGLADFGASRPCGASLQNCLPPAVPLSRLTADPQATILRLGGSAEFRPIPFVTLAVRTRAQYSRAVLVSYEEIGAGNYTIGRGYDPGALLGDSGVGVSFELRLRSAVAHDRSAIAWQPYGFYDGAWSWRNDAGPVGGNPQHIASTGVGLRGGWRNHVRFDMNVAVPLERAPLATKVGSVRFLFTITTRLLPWRS